MRKRVFGSIFLTSLVTLMLTAGLFLLAVHAGLTRDLRSRLAKEAGYLASTVSADSDLSDISSLGLLCADRLTLISRDGTVLYDNQNGASGMETTSAAPKFNRPPKPASVRTAVFPRPLSSRPITMRCGSQTAIFCVFPPPRTALSGRFRARRRGSCSWCCWRCSLRPCSRAA